MCGLGPFLQKGQGISDSETERNVGRGVETGGDAQIVGLSRLYGTLHEIGLELGKLGARVDFSDERCKVKKIIFDHFFLTPQCFSGLAGISVKLLKNAVSGISHREVARGTHI